MLRKEEAEKKYQAAVLRRRQGAEEIACLTLGASVIKEGTYCGATFSFVVALGCSIGHPFRDGCGCPFDRNAPAGDGGVE